MPADGTITVTTTYQIAFAVYLLFALSGVVLRAAILYRVWWLHKHARHNTAARRFLRLSAYWIGGEGITTLALILATVAQALPSAWLWPLVLLFIAGSTAADYGMLLWVAMWLNEDANGYQDVPEKNEPAGNGNGVIKPDALYSLEAWEAYLDAAGFSGGNGNGAEADRGTNEGRAA